MRTDSLPFPLSHPAAACIERLEARIAPAGFVVRNLLPSGVGSLAAAIHAANDSEGADSIRFRPGLHGAIHLTGDLPEITDSLVIAGPVGPRIVIDGGGNFELVHIEGTGLDVTLQKLKLRGGSAVEGGGVFIDDAGGNVLIKRCVITGNSAVGVNDPYAPVAGLGGGVFNGAGTLTLEKSIVSANQADGGGGVANFGSLVVESTKIVGNHAQSRAADGGGLFNAEGATASVVRSTISGNVVQGGRGAAGGSGEAGDNGYDGEPGYDGENGYEGDEAYAGTAGGDARGGGIFNAGTLTIETSTISGNLAQGGNGGNGGNGGDGGNGGKGGPAYVNEYGEYPAGLRGYAGSGGNGGDAGNGGFALGGGIFSAPSSTPLATASLTVKTSTISGNTATGGDAGTRGLGGAMGAGRPADPDPGYGYDSYAAVDGTNGLPGQNGTGDGGGIAAHAGQMTLSQVTIAQNIAGNSGGGMHIDLTNATIHNSTIAANRAPIGGGIFVVAAPGAASVEAISSIVANNLAAVDPDLSGTLTASFSLIRNPCSATVIGVENLNFVDPLLSSLRLHSGPTKTMLPQAASPIIDQGSNPDAQTTDQRGRTRELGSAVDIGAVEVG